jgi:hypothetical protein
MPSISPFLVVLLTATVAGRGCQTELASNEGAGRGGRIDAEFRDVPLELLAK